MQSLNATDDPARFPIENPNPVFRAAADGEILFANRASGYLLTLWGTRVGGPLPAEWQQRIEDVLTSGDAQRLPVPCGERVFELDLVPILARHYVNVYGRDVTEQEAVRQEREALLAELTEERSCLASLADELERERDRQQALMENTRASLVYLDRDFNLVAMNAAYEAACQRPRAEMLRRNHFELFPNAENEAIFRHVRDTGEAVEFLARPFEFADQPWRGVTYWDWTLTPVKRNGEQVEGLVLSLLDVTERIRAAKLSAALNEIHTAVSSKLDRAAMLQTLLCRSVEALGCGSGGVGLREGDCWVLRYGVGLPPSAFGLAMSDEQAPLAALVAREREPVAIRDAGQELALNHRLMAQFGIHAALALPLVVRDEVIGILSFNYFVPRTAFSDAEMDFARKLAALASLAMENARLLESESQQRQAAEQRAAELEATLDAINDGVVIYDREGKFVRQNPAALRILGFEEMFGRMSIAEAVARLRAVLVDDPDAPLEKLPIGRALRGETVRGQLMRLQPANHPDGPATYIMVGVAPIQGPEGRRLGAVISYSDVTELRRARDELEMRVQERTAELEAIFASLPDAILVGDENGIRRCNQAALDGFGCSSIEELHQMSASLADKMQSRYADTGQRIPAGEHVISRAMRGQRVVTEMISRHLKTQQDVIHRTAAAPIVVNGKIVGAVAIATDITEQKRAEEELRANREQLQNLSHRLVELQESERSYVAHQLYNDEGQRLSALLIELSLLEKEAYGNPALAGRIEGMKALAGGVLEDLHSLAVNLRPASLDHLGLIPALCQYAEGLGRQHALAIPVEAAGLREVKLSPEAETAVYRIAQEALANALRHSGAGHIAMVATKRDGRLVLIVEDDGAGFDVDEATRCGRLGILGMRERAAMLGGSLTIESAPGGGTSVYIEVPLDKS